VLCAPQNSEDVSAMSLPMYEVMTVTGHKLRLVAVQLIHCIVETSNSNDTKFAGEEIKIRELNNCTYNCKINIV